MKLPKTLAGIQREGRTDAFSSTAGVEPSLFGWLPKIPKIPGVGDLAGKAACWACKKACNATVC